MVVLPTKRLQPTPKDLDEGFCLESDTESSPTGWSNSVAVMETLTDNPDEKLYNGATTARQVYAQIDQMSLRGRSAFRSEEERTNRISLGSAPSRSKSFEPVVLYESSAKVRLIFFPIHHRSLMRNVTFCRSASLLSLRARRSWWWTMLRLRGESPQ